MEQLDLDALTPIMATHEVGLLVIYGSRARGDARAQSDLDLGAQRLDRRAMDFYELALLQYDLYKWSGLEAQVVDLTHADALLRFEMLKDGRPLFATDPDRWVEFQARTLIDHDDIAYHLPALLRGSVESEVRSNGKHL